MKLLLDHNLSPRLARALGDLFPGTLHVRDVALLSASEEGFGRSDPWGVLSLAGADLTMGMEAQWFVSLEEAVRNAAFWEGQNPSGFEVG